MENMTVERSVWIDADRERVWQAITNDKRIMEWWGDHWEIPTLAVGATIKFGDPSDLMQATIKELEPPAKFVILWPPQAQYHNIEMLTIFLLQEEQNGTRLTIRETGFEALPQDIRQSRYDQTAKGYNTVLNDLKKLLEGETV